MAAAATAVALAPGAATSTELRSGPHMFLRDENQGSWGENRAERDMERSGGSIGRDLGGRGGRGAGGCRLRQCNVVGYHGEGASAGRMDAEGRI